MAAFQQTAGGGAAESGDHPPRTRSPSAGATLPVRAQRRRSTRRVGGVCERRHPRVPGWGARSVPDQRRRLALMRSSSPSATLAAGSPPAPPADGPGSDAYPRARRRRGVQRCRSRRRRAVGVPALRRPGPSEPPARAGPPPGSRRSTAAGRGSRGRAPERGIRPAGPRRRDARSRRHRLAAELSTSSFNTAESTNVASDRSITTAVPWAKIASSSVRRLSTVERSCSPCSSTTHNDGPIRSTVTLPSNDMTTPSRCWKAESPARCQSPRTPEPSAAKDEPAAGLCVVF